MEICFCATEKKYGKEVVLDHLDLRFPLSKGIISFLGPNGIGKTTIMKLLAGILLPTAGSITVTDGLDPYDGWAREHVAYCSSDDRYLSYKLTGIDNIVRYGVLKGVDRKTILSNLEKYAEILHFDSFLNKRVEQMSTGQKKMIKVLAAFCCGYPVLILDEPTNGLDEEARQNLIDALIAMKKTTPCTLFVSSHDFEFIHRITDTHLFMFGKDRVEMRTLHDASLEQLQSAYHAIKNGGNRS